jgi:corrinoid protein of di/trimethylamine methyltransferase
MPSGSLLLMPKEVMSERLAEAVISGDEETARKVSEEIIKSGVDPLEVIEKHLSPAMRRVGEKFEKGEYFLTNLMLSAEAMKAATGILTADLDKEARGRLKGETKGVVVIGTVAGDIHDVGKNILSLLLQVNGFEVHDLGKDLPSMSFIDKAQEMSAAIIALSSLMTTTRPAQKDVIDLLKGMGLRNKITVMVGGAPTTNEWAEQIGADGWTETAEEAVEKKDKNLLLKVCKKAKIPEMYLGTVMSVLMSVSPDQKYPFWY